MAEKSPKTSSKLPRTTQNCSFVQEMDRNGKESVGISGFTKVHTNTTPSLHSFFACCLVEFETAFSFTEKRCNFHVEGVFSMYGRSCRLCAGTV